MKRSVAVMFAALMVASLASGCLGDDEEGLNSLGQWGDDKYVLLRDDPYPKLIIEVDYIQGRNIDSQAKNLLEQRIDQVTDKTDIRWVTDSFTYDNDDDKYSLEELLELTEKHRDHYKGGDTAVIHFLYLDGEFSNGNALGVAYTSSSIAIFKDRIEDAEFLFVSAQDIEKAVVVHEFGHLCGLINKDYESEHDHEDADHPHHSNNDESVMYWAIETVDIGTQLSGEPPNDFDSDDKDDLRGLKKGEL